LICAICSGVGPAAAAAGGAGGAPLRERVAGPPPHQSCCGADAAGRRPALSVVVAPEAETAAADAGLATGLTPLIGGLPRASREQPDSG